MVTSLPNPRYERKFLTQHLTLPEVLVIVRRHAAGFREAYPARIVNNVYLDSPWLSAYHEHVNGACNRVKNRVRWYGKSNGRIGQPVLERKLKCGLVSGKTTQLLPPMDLDGKLFRTQLESVLRIARIPERLRAAVRGLQPSLLNRYRRHYFLSADRRFRLTVDSELEFGSPRDLAQHRPMLQPRLIIIELKFESQHADHAQLITGHLPFRLARCSKYVLGIEHTAAN
jgi:VTC domain-containing protein